MKRQLYGLSLLLSFIWTTCGQNEQQGQTIKPPSVSYTFIISDKGDTIPTGIPIGVEHHKIKPDTAPVPIAVTVGLPRKIKGYTNVYTAFQTRDILIDPQQVKRIIPGKNEVNPLRKVELRANKVPAVFRPVQTVRDPGTKDIARYSIRYMDVEQGLKTSFAKGICHDRKGYIWYSLSGQGVNRYDGQFIAGFSQAEGLISNDIHDILEDANGNLWFAGNRGISRFDGRYFTNYYLPAKQGAILTLFADSRGMIWMGTTHDGVIRYDPDKDSFVQYKDKALFASVTYSITEDRKGNLWFGGAYGALCLNGQSFAKYTRESGLVYPAVSSIAEDDKGQIWMATPEGVSIFNGKAFQNQIFDNKVIPYFHYVFKDSRGQIWMGSKRQGLFRFDGRFFYQYNAQDGLRHNEVLQIIEDDRGQIWFTTYGGGINKMDLQSFRYFSTTDGLIHGFVDNVVADKKENVWIAQEDLIKFDGKDFYQYQLDHPKPNVHVFSIAPDKAGNLWLSTDHGMVKFDEKHFISYGHDYIPYEILPGKGGVFWLMTYDKGVVKFDGKVFTPIGLQEGLPSNKVSALAEDQRGNLWIGTELGLSRFNGEYLTHYTIGNTAFDPYVSCLYVDQGSNLWIGTNYGLYQFRDGKVHSVSQGTALSNDPIAAIREDHKGNIWISTEKGLALLLPDDIGSPSKFQVKTFDSDNELKVAGFSRVSWIDQKHQLWLGSTKGLTVLDLDNYYAQDDDYTPDIHLNGVALNEKDIDFFNTPRSDIEQQLGGKQISFTAVPPFFNYPTALVVPYDVNHISFSYTGIDWKNAPHLSWTLGF